MILLELAGHDVMQTCTGFLATAVASQLLREASSFDSGWCDALPCYVGPLIPQVPNSCTKSEQINCAVPRGC